MKTVKVRFSAPRTAGYDITVQPHLLKQAGRRIAEKFKNHTPFIISSPRIHGFWGSTLETSLKVAGFKTWGLHLIPDGEKNKTFNQFSKALKQLSGFYQADRMKPVVVMLGGGVIGDMGGFVASCYKRGIPFVQIPTTLLSMVDSSVGGKLGVDFDTPQGRIKNLVGAFYQPEMVLIDPVVLSTLERAEIKSGLGEVIKTAVLFDVKLLASLEKHVTKILDLEPEFLTEVISRCVRHKAAVVMKDEFDRSGQRALLNLGHTFGHAVEAASGFKLRHGEAVAFGMVCAADLSLSLKFASRRRMEELSRISTLFERLGMQTRLSGLKMKEVMKAMSQDKKFDGKRRFILIKALGDCFIKEVKRMDMVELVLKSRFL